MLILKYKCKTWRYIIATEEKCEKAIGLVLVNPPHPLEYSNVFKLYNNTKFITHIQPKDSNLQHHKHIAGT